MTLKHYEATVHLRIREGRGKRSPTPTSLSVSVTLVLCFSRASSFRCQQQVDIAKKRVSHGAFFKYISSCLRSRNWEIQNGRN